MTSPSPETLGREVRARTVKEVCRVYGVGKTTIYDLLGDGTLHGIKFGKRTLVLEQSVRTWFDNLPRTKKGANRRG